MSTQQTLPVPGVCSRCGECCRWLPVATVRECNPFLRQYYRERGLKESGGMFLADLPCRHLETGSRGSAMERICAIYEHRPAPCRDYCGKTRIRRTEYYMPEGCTMRVATRRNLKKRAAGPNR